MTHLKPIKLGVALKQFFGYRPSTGPKEFMEEIKALSSEDREDFRSMLSDAGVNVETTKEAAMTAQ